MSKPTPPNVNDRTAGRLRSLARKFGSKERSEPKAPSTKELGSLSLALAVAPEYPYLTESEEVETWKRRLSDQGDHISWVTGRNFKDRRLVEGIKRVSAAKDVDPFTYVKHSNAYSTISRDQKFNGLTVAGDVVKIPRSDDNLHHTGAQRHTERGPRLRLEYLKEVGIDPEFVLYFRVTQPATDGPKPEYFWTSDLREVTQGLNAEGSGNGDPQILVSTLAEISKNGGLMLDVNDDNGIAVRQIDLEPFDQQDALFTFPRYGEYGEGVQ